VNVRSIAALAAFLLLASTASGQLIDLACLSTCQNKIGPYVWVWHMQKLLAGENRPVFVGCPKGDVVLGGGYHESADYPISDSTPNSRFDGWIVNASGGESSGSGNEVKVYAACAPAK
jgi:hypothetical protein